MESFLRRASLEIVLKAVASVGRVAAKGNLRNAQHAHNSCSTKVNGYLEDSRDAAYRQTDAEWKPFPDAEDFHDRIQSWLKIMSTARVQGSSSLNSTVSRPFLIEQSQAGADDFRHGVHNRTQNLFGDNFIGLCRQTAF